jgi:hypothetical protein
MQSLESGQTFRLEAYFRAGVRLGVIDTEDVDDMFLRNVGWYSTNYMALFHNIGTAVRTLDPSYA